MKNILVSQGEFDPNGGVGYNGVYNQDFATTMILIEVGGEYNTYEEVKNSAEAVANVLSEYIKSR